MAGLMDFVKVVLKGFATVVLTAMRMVSELDRK